MIEVFELIVRFFVEIIFEQILRNIFYGVLGFVLLVGLCVIKLLTMDGRRVGVLKRTYDYSSKPYFAGSITIALFTYAIAVL